jgi:hypothetical protein
MNVCTELLDEAFHRITVPLARCDEQWRVIKIVLVVDIGTELVDEKSQHV